MPDPPRRTLPDIRKGYVLVAALFIAERLTAYFVAAPVSTAVLAKSRFVWVPIALLVAASVYYLYCLHRLRLEFRRAAEGRVKPANFPAEFSAFVNARSKGRPLTPQFIVAVFALGLLVAFLVEAALGLLVLFVQLGYLMARFHKATRGSLLSDPAEAHPFG